MAISIDLGDQRPHLAVESLNAEQLRRADDRTLIDAMRAGGGVAWGEFEARFRPALERYARCARIPRGDWQSCITDVLDDAAIRLARETETVPPQLASYLVGAVLHRYLNLKRRAAREERRYSAASDNRHGGRVVSSLCSEDALRASDGPQADESPVSTAVARLAHELAGELTDEEQSILIWVSQGVTHQQIADWIGRPYDATSKRIWRLCRRLRSSASKRVTDYSAAEQTELGRFFRRLEQPPHVDGKSAGAGEGSESGGPLATDGRHDKRASGTRLAAGGR